MSWELRPISQSICKPCDIFDHQIIPSENYFIRRSISILRFTYYLMVAA
jgi:hypothetical protein